MVNGFFCFMLHVSTLDGFMKCPSDNLLLIVYENDSNIMTVLVSFIVRPNVING